MSVTWTNAQEIYSQSVKRSGASTYLSGTQIVELIMKLCIQMKV
jgi:hypothetical protein